MRSRHVDRFNHDDEAADYDLDVQNEDDPIRAGYDALLDWVVERTGAGSGMRVLDLGAGTGNLSARLPAACELVCVDISSEMRRIGAAKLASQDRVSWVSADLIEYFERAGPKFDAIVSTYAIHHLMADEKTELFGRIWSSLAGGGRAVFGDLMFAHADARAQQLAAYRASGDASQVALADDIEDEFFWDVAEALAQLRELGFSVEAQRFSALSWGIAATRPGP
jgi:putative AdoMet-dependent methyltransferase